MANEDGVYTILPPDLPAPDDDGAARHLPGLSLSPIPLHATNGELVDLSALRGRSVVYAYPLTGRPNIEAPDGWDDIPGATGCTPQSCAFRDYHAELQLLGARVFGLSTQSTAYQQEVVKRLQLPYLLLSDADLTFSRSLTLPTFEVERATFDEEAKTLLRRLTMIVRDGRIEHVFYPVFPPDRNASDVIAWLATTP